MFRIAIQTAFALIPGRGMFCIAPDVDGVCVTFADFIASSFNYLNRFSVAIRADKPFNDFICNLPCVPFTQCSLAAKYTVSVFHVYSTLL